MDQQPWRRKAKCRDLDGDTADELFDISVGKRSTKAKRFCRDCPVRRECLAFALTYNEQGVWAGFTKNERSRILKTVGVPNVIIGIEYRLDLSRLLGIRNQRVVQLVAPAQRVPTLEEVLAEIESLVPGFQDGVAAALERAEELLAAL